MYCTQRLINILSIFRRKRSVSTDDDRDEKYFENPTYERSYEEYATPNIYKVQTSPEREEVRYVETRYDSVELHDPQTEKDDGQTYHVLDRGLTKSSGKHLANNHERSLRDSQLLLHVHVVVK